MNFFKNIINKIIFSYYWPIYKKNKYLKTKKENLIAILLSEITNYKIDKRENFLLNLIDIPFLEIAHRQCIIEKLIAKNHFSFRKNFVNNFNSKKGMSMPLILQHISFFETKGYKINKFQSSIKLLIIIFFEFFKSINIIIKTLFNFSNSFVSVNNYAQFCDLPKDFRKVGEEKYSIFTWFIKYFNEKKFNFLLLNENTEITQLSDGTKIKFLKEKFLPLNIKKKFKFLIYSLIILIYCFFQIFNFKNWYRCLMVREYLNFYISKLQEKEKLAKVYMLSQASYIYKPLWTYEVEKKGSQVVMYYFACSFDSYFKNNQYPPSYLGFSSMNWNNIFVWSKNFKEYHSKIATNSKFILTNPIFYKDKNINYNICKPSISVFDVAPYRDIIRNTTYLNEDFRDSKNTINFIRDIVNLSSKYEVNIYFKSSKNLDDKKYDKKYRNYISNCSKLDNFFIVDYLASPFQLIEKTDISISLPFTSPGVIPRYFKKDGYYYDPTKTLSKNDRAVQKGLLVSGYDELEIIFRKKFNLYKSQQNF